MTDMTDEKPRTIITVPEILEEGAEYPPQVRAYISAVMFLAGYVQANASAGHHTEEELIEHVGLNIRRVINPKYDETKVS